MLLILMKLIFYLSEHLYSSLNRSCLQKFHALFIVCISLNFHSWYWLVQSSLLYWYVFFKTFFTLTKRLTRLFALIPLIGIVAIIYLVRHHVQIYIEIRLIKKLYKKFKWSVECYYAFFEEGIYIKSVDMEGVFY